MQLWDYTSRGVNLGTAAGHWFSSLLRGNADAGFKFFWHREVGPSREWKVKDPQRKTMIPMAREDEDKPLYAGLSFLSTATHRYC